MATTKRWTRWNKYRGTDLEGIGGDERTTSHVSRVRAWSVDDPFVWTVSRMVRAPETALGWKLRDVAFGNEETLPAARKAAEDWLEQESIVDTMLSDNAASKKNGGAPFWSDEALVQAFEAEGATHSDAIAAVEGAKHPLPGSWGSAGETRFRTDEEQAAIDRIETRAPTCDCAPEDGDYGSGFHFEGCPKAPAQKAAMDRAEALGRVYIPSREFEEDDRTDAAFVEGSKLEENVPDYSRGLMGRIASGEQAKIDAEIDRFDRRLERRSEDRPFVPAWRRRELERLEAGETAGKDLGVAEEVPSYGAEPDAYGANLSREELEKAIRKAEAVEYRTGGSDDQWKLDALRDELDRRGYRDDDYLDGFRLGAGQEVGLLEENRSEHYYRGYEAGADKLAADAKEQARDAARRARDEREDLAAEERELEIQRTARTMDVSPDEAARIRGLR